MSSEGGKSRSWSIFKKSKKGSTSLHTDDSVSISDDASASSRSTTSMLRFSTGGIKKKKKNKVKTKGSGSGSSPGQAAAATRLSSSSSSTLSISLKKSPSFPTHSDDYSTASTESSKRKLTSLQRHLDKNNGYVDTGSGDEHSMISGLSSVGGGVSHQHHPTGSSYGSPDWAGVYSTAESSSRKQKQSGNSNNNRYGHGHIHSHSQSHAHRSKENRNRIVEEDGDDDDDDIMAIPSSLTATTPPVRHTPGMSAEDKFMAYFQKKQPLPSSEASHRTSATFSSIVSTRASPSGTNIEIDRQASLSSPQIASPLDRSTDEQQQQQQQQQHLQLDQLDRRQQAELNANRLREKQRQRQLKVLEQRRQREMEAQAKAESKPGAPPQAQEQYPVNSNALSSATAQVQYEDISEIFMSPEDARKDRARKAVEERKAKARAAVEARKAKARAAKNGGIDPDLAVLPAEEGKELLKEAFGGASSASLSSNGSRSRKSGRSSKSSRSGRSGKSSRSGKKKRRSRSIDSIGGSSMGSIETTLSEKQQEQIQLADDEMKAAEAQAREEQRGPQAQKEEQQKRIAETEHALRLEAEMVRAEKAQIEAARLKQEQKKSEVAVLAAKARVEKEAQERKELDDLRAKDAASKAEEDRKLEEEKARAEMLDLQDQLSSPGLAKATENGHQQDPDIVVTPTVIEDDTKTETFGTINPRQLEPLTATHPTSETSIDADVEASHGKEETEAEKSDSQANLPPSDELNDILSSPKMCFGDDDDDDDENDIGDLDKLLDDDLSALLDDSDASESALDNDLEAIASEPNPSSSKKTDRRPSPTKSALHTRTQGTSNLPRKSEIVSPQRKTRPTPSPLPAPRPTKNTPDLMPPSIKKNLFHPSGAQKTPSNRTHKVFTFTTTGSASDAASVDGGSTRSKSRIMRRPPTRSTPRRRKQRYSTSPSRSVASASSEIGILPRSPHRPVSDDESEFPTCDHPFIAKLHRTRGHCQVCVYHLSEEERVAFAKNGRHLRVNIAYGGCEDCQVFLKENEDEEPVRLCCKCFFDTHKMGKHTHRPFSGGLVFAGASPMGHR